MLKTVFLWICFLSLKFPLCKYPFIISLSLRQSFHCTYKVLEPAPPIPSPHSISSLPTSSSLDFPRKCLELLQAPKHKAVEFACGPSPLARCWAVPVPLPHVCLLPCWPHSWAKAWLPVSTDAPTAQVLLLKTKGFLSPSAFSDDTETRLQSYNLSENWFIG